MKIRVFLYKYVYWYITHPLWLVKWFQLKFSGVEISISARVSNSAYIKKSGGRIVIHANATINDNVRIIAQGGIVIIGSNVSINYGSILYGHGGLTIGNDTRVAAYSMFIPMNHVFDDKDILIRNQPTSKEGISIGQDVWIGARATILDGVFVGDGAVIGACSVVTKNIDKHGVYAGNPAKFLRMRGK
jgi:acetyltransferase-like isoleucine patch superfamily enzyme